MQLLSLTSSLLFAVLSQSNIASAQPTDLLTERALSPALQAAAYNTLIARYTGEGGNSESQSCNLQNAKLPDAVPLPPPSAGLALTHVVVGRGTQNYTCADSTEKTIPVAAGAIATLFNTTCLAAYAPQLLAAIPGIALRFPIPTAQTVANAADRFLSGHHYFTDLTTPYFNLDTGSHNWGGVAVKKLNGTNAPNPENDVPWLKLITKTATGCTISEVYRVNTAGGQPPKTCAGKPKTFEVQYAAEYWMYSGPSDAPYGS